MKKLLRIISSRFFVSAFVIILEFILVFIVFLILKSEFNIFNFLADIFLFATLLYIINNYKNSEFKLPWIIIILLFNVFGAFIFVLLISNKYTKKTSANFCKIKEELRKNISSNNIYKIENNNIDAYLQAKYITKSVALPLYTNSKSTYFKTGEDFFNDLTCSLNRAKNYIFMEYFIIDNGDMWNEIYKILKEKAKNNVKVYILYDDFGCLKTLDENYYKELEKENINCIPSNKFKPILSNFHNNRDHRKITVVDGLIGYTGGINIADEYINKKNRFGHWKDSSIKIEGEAVKNLAILFLEMWNMQSNKKLMYEEFLNINYKHYNETGIIIPYGFGPEKFYQNSVGKNIYLNMINSAKKSIYITTPYLICEYELLNALIIATKKGIDVKIILPHIPDKKNIFLITKYNYELLIKNGVKIYEYIPGFIHSKNIICDNLFAICGTINFDYRSLVHNFESAVWIYNINAVKEMQEDFINTLNESKEITLENKELKGLKKVYAEILKIFSPLF